VGAGRPALRFQIHIGRDTLANIMRALNISGMTYWGSEMNSKFSKGSRVGLTGIVLLLMCYLRLFAFRFMSPEWSIAVLALSITTVVMFAVAGRLSSWWWYCGIFPGLLSAFFVFAFAWG